MQFLHDLLQKAVQSRSSNDEDLDETLSLFQTRHVEAVFNAMDPYDMGVVSFIEYHNGGWRMVALSLRTANGKPLLVRANDELLHSTCRLVRLRTGRLRQRARHRRRRQRDEGDVRQSSVSALIIFFKTMGHCYKQQHDTT